MNGGEGGPLQGLRVIDATGDAGRFATKLLTEFGADVVRVSTSGAPGRALRDDAANALGGVLDWWYDGGKRKLSLDLASDAGRSAYRRLAGRADAIVETAEPGFLASHGIDHAQLLADNPRLVQVSITPFGRHGPRAHWAATDLVLNALGGVLSVTGTPDRPLNLWGRQAYQFAGFTAALLTLAGVRAARLDGRGRHYDLSIQECVTTTIEHLLMYLFYDAELPELPRVAARQGALHWLKVYDLAPTLDGTMMVTTTPEPRDAVAWMVERGHEAARAFQALDDEALSERRVELMDVLRDFVATRPTMETWQDAQRHHNASAGVYDVAAVAGIPQFAYREFFADLAGGKVRMPARMVRFSDTPARSPEPPATDETALEGLLESWPGRDPGAPGAALARPLEGVRVADFTWVLAGPFCTRMLADLGADVIRVQNEARSTLVNSPEFPYYPVWNRSKRSATLNMKHPEALAAARRLIERSDVLIENYSAGVFARWGMDWETLREWNPRLIYVTMSGCGHDGPWQHIISYAPTIHALSGITHLTNFADRSDVGPGFSLNDSLAGYAAAVALMAALEARERTGRGQKIDMAQLEIGSYAIGPALIEYFSNGEAPQPAGNRDGLDDHVPSGVYPSRDGFVAVSAPTDSAWRALAAVVGGNLRDPALAGIESRRRRVAEIDAGLGGWLAARTAAQAVETLQAAGVPAGKVQDAEELFAADPQLAARGYWLTLHSEVFGERPVEAFPAFENGERLTPLRPAPAWLGEHNLAVWTEVAGFDEAEVLAGMASGLFS